jgi:hypothetical protein
MDWSKFLGLHVNVQLSLYSEDRREVGSISKCLMTCLLSWADQPWD